MFNLFKKESSPTKGDYVVVFHTWFVHSIGWEQFVFKGVTYEEVLAETLKIKEKKSGTFCHVSYKIIEWEDGV